MIWMGIFNIVLEPGLFGHRRNACAADESIAASQELFHDHSLGTVFIVTY